MADESTVEKLKEILTFLSISARGDVKLIAVEYVCGLTGSLNGCQLLTDGDRYLAALVQLTADVEFQVQKLAYDGLINVTSYPESAQKLLNSGDVTSKALEQWVKHLYDKTYMSADSVCQLLTNITRSEKGADAVAKALESTGGSLERLVEILCSLNYNPKANFHYLATVISNLTQLEDVRKDFMDRNNRTLQKMAAFVGYEASGTRRRGAVGVLRNCCLDANFHDWLLSDAVDVLPRLLLPLAGPEEFDEDDMEKLPEDLQYLPPDKQRESCVDIREMLVEAVIQLCNTKQGRHQVKSKNTYVIMRELYNWEKSDACQQTIHDLIDILIGDEPMPEHETLKDIEVPADLTEKFVEDKKREQLGS